jgi:hypothetical protein
MWVVKSLFCALETQVWLVLGSDNWEFPGMHSLCFSACLVLPGGHAAYSPLQICPVPHQLLGLESNTAWAPKLTSKTPKTLPIFEIRPFLLKINKKPEHGHRKKKKKKKGSFIMLFRFLPPSQAGWQPHQANCSPQKESKEQALWDLLYPLLLAERSALWPMSLTTKITASSSHQPTVMNTLQSRFFRKGSS